MAINYIHPETGESVPREAWHWVAIYDDGSELHQFEFGVGGPVFHPIKEVDQDRLVEFQMRHVTLPTIVVPYHKGAKLKHFYRNMRQIPGDGAWVRYYFAGYILNDQYTLLAITDKNEVILTHDPDLVVRRNAPELSDGENVQEVTGKA